MRTQLRRNRAAGELIDGLADLASAQGYANVDAFAAYVARKLEKKLGQRRGATPDGPSEKSQFE